MSSSVKAVEAEFESTLNTNRSPSVTEVVQPVKVVESLIFADVNVGFAEAVMVFATVGIAPFAFQMSTTIFVVSSEVSLYPVMVPLLGAAITPVRTPVAMTEPGL
jgi:hypothetical protein